MAQAAQALAPLEQAAVILAREGDRLLGRDGGGAMIQALEQRMGQQSAMNELFNGLGERVDLLTQRCDQMEERLALCERWSAQFHGHG
ncbi:unnamed protein product [Rhizoctonia solani]|uniref:Uncharacterized protein n=1 Tax=Rhizoctonia solani TaxID=456999 RepID=A0A8H3H3W5_9AGAM|nr:unnamed protein product [Rhizoctonia solani]